MSAQKLNQANQESILKRDTGLWSSLKYCDFTKNGGKTGFSLITHDTRVKNITARLILYLGILARLLNYCRINSVKQLFSRLFFILDVVEKFPDSDNFRNPNPSTDPNY